MAGTYDRGDLVRLTATFTNDAGAATDPTTVTLRIKAPGGILSAPTPAQDNPGVYHYDLDLNAVGPWYYRWEGTGVVQTAEESLLFVRDSMFS